MEREFGITRDVRDSGIAGWRVRIRRSGKQLANRFFTDTTYGGEEKSLEASRQYRNQVAKENGIATSKTTNPALFMARQKLGMTQADCAALLDVKPLTYCRWEGSKKECPKHIPDLLEFVAKQVPAMPRISSKDLEGLRNSLGFNKTQMGELIDVRYDTYARWEQERTKPDGWVMVFFSAVHAGWKPTV